MPPGYYTRPRTNIVTFTNDLRQVVTLRLRSADLAARMAQDKGGTWTKES